MVKKKIAAILCAATIVGTIPCQKVFAGEVKSKDVYAQHYVEKLKVDGENYTYKYYYKNNGQRAISILDEKGESEGELTTNEDYTKFYLNGEEVAQITETNEVDDQLVSSNSDKTRAAWKSQGTFHKKITWKSGLKAAVVAGIIGTALGFVAGSATTVTVAAALVTGSAGANTMVTIAGMTAGGTLHSSPYYKFEDGGMYYKIDWSFVAPTGERYGTYHINKFMPNVVM